MVESYISELLPAKYRKRHQLMLYLYDILVDILVKADKYQLSSLSFRFTNEIDEKTDLFDELERQKDIDISEKVFIPHIFFSILRDLNYYLFESLSCIERGKVTVAFSLARKPLQDNLFYLGWILVQPHDFLGKVQYGSPREYDVSDLKGKKDFVIDLFSKAKELVQSKNSTLDFSQKLLNPELLYDVIYNRKAENSLTSAFDKSIHLVTKNINYPTEKQNLNFIFADDKIWDEFWNLYYQKIPYILLYLVEVVIAIFEKYIDIDEETSEFNQYIRNLKIILALSGDDNKGLENIFDLIFSSDHLSMTCDECGNQFEFNTVLVNEIRGDYLYTCQKCGFVERLGQYFVSDEFLSNRRKIMIDNTDNDNWKLI
ncbi:hypothetical protein [Streptococcus iniae]|uniref:Uncharacterized protein n=1 Tax=Streptococcus iniae TaxID=1346 RepID=A0ABM5QK12_STRIN|nr:hypothetical protein [Streptococcus iniae]AHY16537.1 hypothetical protein DQ08_08825 [Streptococcus iniae]AHY18403.1 hypothetical protein DW64_08810 [Streptococcus iniae]MCA1357911.1 hypothetical protein [Streptococcus iniae]HEK4516922.1 hypothetical protein [Streptococcus iniae]